jgi:hypothetical protein
MRDIFPAFGRMWILRNDSVGRPITPKFPGRLKLNLERPEINAVERNRFSSDSEPMSATIEVTSLELVAECQQILVNVADGGNAMGFGRTWQALPNGRELVHDWWNCVAQVTKELVCRQVPAAQLSAADLAHKLSTPVPRTDRKFDERVAGAVRSELTVKVERQLQ